MQLKSEWITASRREPCPICEKTDWCTRTADGEVARCMRITSDKPAQKGGWIHRLADPRPIFSPARKPKPDVRPDIDWTGKAKAMYEHAEAAATREALSVTLGVALDALDALRVGRGFDDHKFCAFSSWPERYPNGQVAGIIRRFADGSKKTMKWSHHGLYFAREWWSRPGPIVCPEGGSDTAALISLELAAIGRPSNAGGIDLLTKMLMAGRRDVFILGERDEKPERRGQPKTAEQCPTDCKGCSWCWPGFYGARHTATELRRHLRRGNIIACLPSSKDVRAWLMEKGLSYEAGLEFIGALEVID